MSQADATVAIDIETLDRWVVKSGSMLGWRMIQMHMAPKSGGPTQPKKNSWICMLGMRQFNGRTPTAARHAAAEFLRDQEAIAKVKRPGP